MAELNYDTEESSFLENDSTLLEINIEDRLRSKLLTIASWSKVVAIAGFAIMGVNILDLVWKGSISYFFNLPTLLGSLLTLTINFFINFFLIRFSLQLKRGVENENQSAFNEASGFLKAYLRLLGMLIIVASAFMLLGILMIFVSI